MKINADTKLSQIFRTNPAAIDAIISIDLHYEKLRNPILRKLMAGRTSIRQAAKIGNCKPEDFFRKLETLGFEIDRAEAPAEKTESSRTDFMRGLKEESVVELDVRPVLSSGADPLSMILEKLKEAGDEKVLKIINSFEPAPLIALLKKQGYESFSGEMNNGVIETWFKKSVPGKSPAVELKSTAGKGWDFFMDKFKNRLVETDVREMEMPMPMMTILEALEKLPAGDALLVHHKRIPVFLLPELQERGFDYRVKENGNDNVQLLIFRS